jgi:hypothetical protein
MEQDQKQSLALLAALALALIVSVLGLIWVAPDAIAMINDSLSPGVGIKQAAIFAFMPTVILFVVFALAAGDGLLGEIQFVISGFGLFYLVAWIMIAWIF